MIELIDSIAYFKGITHKDQSIVMYNYLKGNPTQKLYIIEGAVHRYGIAANDGSLIQFDNIPATLKENGFCLNPFYASEPFISNKSEVPLELIENSKEVFTPELEPICGAIQCGSCKDKIQSLEQEVDYCNTELDRCEFANKELRQENAKLREKLSEFQKEKEKELNSFSSNTISANRSIDKNDIRGLCKALHDMGFSVNLNYSDYDLELEKEGL